jgi:hypothetical protein
LSKLGWDDASVEGAVKSEFGSDARSKSAQYQENQRFLSTQTGPRAAAGERARRGVALEMPANQEERDAQAASRFTDPNERNAYLQGLKDNRARSAARENIVGGREGALALPQTTVEAARSAVIAAGTLQPGTPAFEQEVQRQTAASTIVDAKDANSYFDPQTGQRAKGGMTLAEVNKSHVYLDEGQKKQFANLKGAAAGLAVARTALKDLPRTGSPLQNFAMRKLIGVFQPGKVQRIERMMASAGQSARAISAEVGTLRNEDIDRALKLFDPRTTWTTTQDMEIAISMTEKAFADAALSLGLQPSALGLDMTPKVKSVGEALP